MLFFFEILRIFDVRDFNHVRSVSYPGLLATTKLIREDFDRFVKYYYITVSLIRIERIN